MKQLQVYPNEWPCTLSDCPPGLFTYGETLCFKSEYSTNGRTDAYIAESGESFQGGAINDVARESLIVQHCDHFWSDDSE